MHEYSAKVERWVDGDTVDLDIDLGFDIRYNQRVRLYGINTPETRTRNLEEKKKGLEAKAFVEDYVARNDGNWSVLEGRDHLVIPSGKLVYFNSGRHVSKLGRTDIV